MSCSDGCRSQIVLRRGMQETFSDNLRLRKRRGQVKNRRAQPVRQWALRTLLLEVEVVLDEVEYSACAYTNMYLLLIH